MIRGRKSKNDNPSTERNKIATFFSDKTKKPVPRLFFSHPVLFEMKKNETEADNS